MKYTVITVYVIFKGWLLANTTYQLSHIGVKILKTSIKLSFNNSISSLSLFVKFFNGRSYNTRYFFASMNECSIPAFLKREANAQRVNVLPSYKHSWLSYLFWDFL